jgi:hypothetical protein
MVSMNFDPTSVEDDGGPAPIPAGRYLLEIVDTKSIANKKGTGEYLFIVYRVVEGAYEGRKVFDRLNYINQSEQAQNIARKQLKRLCALCGIDGELIDSEQLHFKRFHANVVVKPDEGFGPQNEVRYPAAANPDQTEIPFETDHDRAATNGKPKPPAPRPSPAPRPQPGAKRPWEQKPKF